jgi:hypothetical protein
VQVLNFNTGITFGSSGNLREFSPIGFSPNPDDVSTWSEAPVAELTFRLPPLRHDVQVSVEVFPYLADGLIPQQSCWVYFNGLFVYFCAVRSPQEMVFTISRDMLNPRANRLSFALPNATSPHELNVGDDLRQLGLSFVKLSAGPPAG